MLRGGISDPRNKTLMKMFNMIGFGERAGSGISDIYQVWENEGWEMPVLSKNEDSGQPQCPEDKDRAIVEALEHFKMIQVAISYAIGKADPVTVQIDTFGTPHLDEDIIKRSFIKALNILVRERDIIIADFEEIRDTAFSTEGLNAEVEVLFVIAQ